MIHYAKIEGLIAPTFTSFNEDGEINTGIISAYAEKLRKKGLKGVFILGSSGEGMLMSVRERKTVTEVWAKERSDEFKLIVHVGANAYKDAQELALHAVELGADALSIMAPTFLQPKTIKGLIAYIKIIADVVPDTPLYYYHIPVRTRVNFNMIDLLHEVGDEIPNFVGIKYTNSNFKDMQQCILFDNEKYDILHGSDETLLCGLSLGIKGGIGTTYNLIPELYYGMIEAFDANNIEKSRQLQAYVVELMNIISKYGGGIVAGKHLMKIANMDCGPCRLPLNTIHWEEAKAMENELKAKGLYDPIKNAFVV
jgi:N-acetylneuraminate lyase